MTKAKADGKMLAEHVLEVRYAALGSFLDVRGRIADYVRRRNLFPHWKIDSNVVNFRDDSEGVKREGAFVGYKSAGYVTLDPATRNYFADRASRFWKSLQEYDQFKIPTPTRFGARTKIFVPSEHSFEAINKASFETLFSDKARSLIGEETDFQFTIELREDVFDVRVSGGPIHKDEAGRYFQFESDRFNQCGLYLDIDYFKSDGLAASDIPQLLKKAIELSWCKAEQIASGVGL
ncbi:MAG: hypothetical protein KKG33_03245 [candidate division Zixibacteria bacterium]|nr:hypothetical protein [candidate division Zixibacteria bacterium]MBU1469540.1 hypothetical protein [candidate division Zixibacteria bacterium]MBU2624558.1 hypothetical protein [candidate division Zixibacteria bacterium]